MKNIEALPSSRLGAKGMSDSSLRPRPTSASPDPGRRDRLTLTQYLRFRLGTRGGFSAWFNFFIKPFEASSFAEFWRLWNPVYGYFLYRFAYRPMRRVLPRAFAVLLTFAASGFVLHDIPAWLIARRVLPPGATIAFIMFGVGAVASDAVHMNLWRLPEWMRGVVNVIYLAVCVLAMLLLVRRFVS
jgi:D-alanyl-lipoteichoic acid acyltransferase DltB (MBOAT superfamily)